MATTDEIKSWLDRADTAQVELEDLRWRAAEALFLANKAAGRDKKSQATLAAAIGRDQSTVSKYIWCWTHQGPANSGGRSRTPWAEAWREATDTRRQPKPGGKSSRPGPKPKPNNSQGNKGRPDPEWEAMAAEVRAARSLTENHPEVVAVVVPEDLASDMQKWADDLIHWSKLFAKALDQRFAFESDIDDPIMTD